MDIFLSRNPRKCTFWQVRKTRPVKILFILCWFAGQSASFLTLQLCIWSISLNALVNSFNGTTIPCGSQTGLGMKCNVTGHTWVTEDVGNPCATYYVTEDVGNPCATYYVTEDVGNPCATYYVTEDVGNPGVTITLHFILEWSVT